MRKTLCAKRYAQNAGQPNRIKMPQLTFNKQIWSIPEKDAEYPIWQVYFEKLKDAFDTENARNIWLLTWQVNGQALLTGNKDFLDWLQKNKIDVSNAGTRALAGVSSLFSTYKNILLWGGGGILAIILIVVLRSAWKGNLIQDASNFHPIGRLANASKTLAK